MPPTQVLDTGSARGVNDDASASAREPPAEASTRDQGVADSRDGDASDGFVADGFTTATAGTGVRDILIFFGDGLDASPSRSDRRPEGESRSESLP